MSEPAPTPVPTPTPTPAPTPQAPWYEGKADAETLGYWQNKAWKSDDPVNIALEATKAAREAQKFVGAPPERLIRLPADAKDEAGWKDVWSRLGAPKEAKEYDFSAVKRADGTPIDESLAETIRQAAFTSHTPKETAAAIAASLVKHLDGQKASQDAETASKVAAEKAALAKSWGVNEAENRLTATQGAKRLGVTPEQVQALENTIGYAGVMEMFRKIGAGTSEDTFVDGNNAAPKTAGSAQARLTELMADQAWGKRLLAGDVSARREYESLTEQITGISASAA